MSDNAHDLGRLVGLVVAERYRIDALLGEGGMGAVFRAQHLGLRRDVALKILRPELVMDTEVSARFDREARSASRLEHPNCVRVTDFGTFTPPKGGVALKYMVMQFLSGHELGDLLGRPLPAHEAIALAGQILAGLEHAHGRGIVHRDIKPENVFVTTDHTGARQLKLVDFGIAKILSGEGATEQMTRVGLIFGTPRYMSPEQAAGGTIDERTDLYAAGIILYEMLAGSPPFSADDLVELLRMQLSTPPPALPGRVDRELADLVMSMLAKQPNERPESAAAVGKRLQAIDRRLSATPAPSAPVPFGMDDTIAPGFGTASLTATRNDTGRDDTALARSRASTSVAPTTAEVSQSFSMASMPPRATTLRPKRSRAMAWTIGVVGVAAIGLVAWRVTAGTDEPAGNTSPAGAAAPPVPGAAPAKAEAKKAGVGTKTAPPPAASTTPTESPPSDTPAADDPSAAGEAGNKGKKGRRRGPLRRFFDGL